MCRHTTPKRMQLPNLIDRLIPCFKIWIENSSTQDKVTLIARKRSPSEIGSFDESARLIHYFSLIFFVSHHLSLSSLMKLVCGCIFLFFLLIHWHFFSQKGPRVFCLLIQEWSLPQGLQDLQKDFALRLY
ncbi:hypothetical protein ACB092_12G088300 [Castanea dentata]